MEHSVSRFCYGGSRFSHWPFVCCYDHCSADWLLPFSYDMVSKSEIEGDADKNILWQTYGFILKAVYVLFLGIPMVILTLVQIVCCFCSIIGIPVAIVMAKSLGTLLQPVGKVCVDHSVAQALLVEQGRSQLAARNKIERQ